MLAKLKAIKAIANVAARYFIVLPLIACVAFIFQQGRFLVFDRDVNGCGDDKAQAENIATDPRDKMGMPNHADIP